MLKRNWVGTKGTINVTLTFMRKENHNFRNSEVRTRVNGNLRMKLGNITTVVKMDIS